MFTTSRHKPAQADSLNVAAVCNIVEETASEKHGLTIGELRTLARFQVMNEAGSKATNTRLATATGERQNSIARNSAALRRKGLIVRLPGKTVSITEEGRKVLSSYRRELARAMDRLQNVG